MTIEEILDMQIEHYQTELRMSVKNLQQSVSEKPNWGYACTYAVQSARQANELSSLMEIKFIMSQQGKEGMIRGKIFNNG